jgi:hypothetical protein
MNVDQIAKMEGKLVRLRPVPKREDESGNLIAADYHWRIGKVKKAKRTVGMSVVERHMTMCFGLDHILGFESNPNASFYGESVGFFKMKIQVIFSNDRHHIRIEPL